MLRGVVPHWKESPALYAIIVGVDGVERGIPDMVEHTVYSRDQLQAFVDSARRAQLAPLVMRQHLVSEKLIRLWKKQDVVTHYRVPDASLASQHHNFTT